MKKGAYLSGQNLVGRGSMCEGRLTTRGTLVVTATATTITNITLITQLL